MRIICHGLMNEDFPVEFTGKRISLGADDSNTITVKTNGISAFHALLIEKDEDLFIQNSDNSNGTRLNNRQIHDMEKLAPGDIFQIGCQRVRVDFCSDGTTVLNFISSDQPQDVSTDITLVSPEVGNKNSSCDNVEHTLVMTPEMESSGSSSSTKGLFLEGEEIGKYVIIKRIGKGGMGEVYLARHITLGSFRALKILSKELAESNAQFIDRFIREAKLASEIRHANVVSVMDVETDPICGTYIVMEYVDGGSLRNSLTANKRLSEEQAVVIIEAIASALHAAEEHNIVHRDIKPDNIMFTKQGEVKLADLGIAKNSDTDNELTKPNTMIGTPAYLSPEQARNAKSVDCRADIYSLGVTFYEMLTGQQPYSGDNTIEILQKLFSDPVPDPRKINPEVSPASVAIIMKMMAKDPKDRFQNASELLDALDRTFPPHNAHESNELIRKVIAGECTNNADFSSGIASSHLSLWWLKVQNKRLVLAATGLFIACCIIGIMFLFLGKHPVGTSKVDSETAAPLGNLYSLTIRTMPDADIQLFYPDGQAKMYSSDSEGLLLLPELGAGKYKVWIVREHFNMRSQEFELNGDLTLDLPLSGAIEMRPTRQL